ncbi:MAG: M56 family metallopeptidase [Clostridia bacterium]|nr:M56 family metallopeptidase [Clostridia bacterium]
MEAVFLHILNIAITASWLVLAVLLLRLVLKKAPKWATCLLWGIVALRLLLPFSLESALSVIPDAEPIPESIIITGTPTVNSGLEGGDQVPGEVPDQVPDSVISGSLAPVPGDSVDPVQVLVLVASIVWLVGILVMLSYGAFSYFRLKHKMRASIVKEGRVYLCDHIDTPFILGIFRPRIYLPSGMAESEIPYVLAHEEAHLRRKDHLWKPLGFLLLSVYWFNPLLWVGYILLCRDIENACDEKAIKDSDTAYKVS